MLDRLAQQIVRLTCESERTAVLVTPEQFSLTPDFFVALLRELSAAGAKERFKRIEVDCYHQATGITAWWAGLRMGRTTRRIAAEIRRAGLALDVDVRISSLIGRSVVGETLVLGCCDWRDPLPSWSAAIELSTAAVPQRTAPP